MGKAFLLFAGLCLVITLAPAQTGMDIQQDMKQLQQKVKTLQSADQQVKGQVAALKKEQEAFREEVRASLKTGDSLMKAGLDSIGVTNDRALKNEQADVTLRASLSLQQNLLIIALVIIVCLIALFIWQRRVIRNLALLHEADVKKLEEFTGKQSAETASKLGVLGNDLDTRTGTLKSSLSDLGKKTEEKLAVNATEAAAGISGLKQELRESSEKIISDQKAGIEAEKRSREEALASVAKKLQAVDEKAESGLAETMTFMKQETEHYRKEMAELRKILQEVSKAPKSRGNSAE